MSETMRDVAPEQGPGYTVIGVLEDGAELSQTLVDLQGLGLDDEDLTVVLKRPDPDEPEPFPEGTRYIVVPDNARGLAEPVGFAVVFVIVALLFAFTTPSIGPMLFLFFIGLAAILAASTFFKVGAMPILIDMQAPPEESGFWNEEFENGKVLLFASSEDKQNLTPVWRMLQERAIYFDVISKRLVPRPVNTAVLHQAARSGDRNRRAEPLQAGEEG